MTDNKLKKSNVLIVGFGYLGRELAAQLLLRNKFNIWTISRSAIVSNLSVNHIIDDLTKPLKQQAKLPKHLDYVIYVIAADTGTLDSYYNAYILSLKNLIIRLKGNNTIPKKFFFISSTSVYHQHKGQWVDETSSTNPTYFRGKIMLEAEALLRNSEISTSILRLGGIYGPNRFYLVDLVKQKNAYYKKPIVYSNRIHLYDAVNIIIHLIGLLDKNINIYPLYLIVDSAPSPIYEIMQWIAKNLNLPLEGHKIPYSMQNKRCCNKLIVSSGYKFIYPTYKSGMQDLLENAKN